MCIFLQVHLELAKYNDVGRFTNHEPQMDCAMFHLEQAAACSVLPAIVTMAEIYLQLPHDILASATVQVFKVNSHTVSHQHFYFFSIFKICK